MNWLDLVLSLFRKTKAFADTAMVPPEMVETPAGISKEGVDLIKRFEGCAKLRRDGLIEAYPDPGTGGAPWTIGWGATGPDIYKGLIWTRQDCDNRLIYDLKRFEREVARLVAGYPTTQAQFDALVSFQYNTGALGRSTLLKKHRAGDYRGARGQFLRWVHAGGKVLPGLVRRREAESELYMRGQ